MSLGMNFFKKNIKMVLLESDEIEGDPYENCNL